MGAGRHALTTIYPALTAADYIVRGIATRNLESAHAVAARYGARGYNDIDTMLLELRNEIDAIIVVVPPDGYEDVVGRCLSAGLPIYCEKPASMTSSALRSIEQARAAAGTTVMVGYMKRFAPAYQRAKALMGETNFGKASTYSSYWGMGPEHHPTLDYLMRENATHHLDLARYLMGEVRELEAWVHEPKAKSIAVSVLLRFESGAVGTLNLNNLAAWDHNNEWISVNGHGPVVLVDNVECCIYRVPGQPERRWMPNYTVPDARNSSLEVTGFTGALRHFTDVVRQGARCKSDLASALATMELAERVLAKARVDEKGEASE